MTNKKRSKKKKCEDIKDYIKSSKDKPLSKKVVLAEIIMIIKREKMKQFKYDNDDILWAKSIIDKVNKSERRKKINDKRSKKRDLS